MTFAVATRYKQVAALINTLDSERLPLLLTSLIQKLHNKSTRLFTEEEEEKLAGMFSLSTKDLKDVLECLSYTFEQSAFTSTNPEDLYNILLSGEFDESHARIVSSTWAAEAASYVAKLKDQKLGFRTLKAVDYRLNMVVHESDLMRQQDPVGIFELKIGDPVTAKNDETLQLEFNHAELYAFFSDLERLQQQIDTLSR